MCSAPRVRQPSRGKPMDYQSSMNETLSAEKRTAFAKKANAAYERRHPNEEYEVSSKKNKTEKKTKAIVHRVELILLIVVIAAIGIRVLFMTD
ncbi:hypothetical protein JL49_10100 [Pseudoalteromonas luteoviolacea]|uniref:Uncharacterized protein n=2 Tax=Pseudoalteromonas luteoviolacea TaxID=43657 RepID=A0A167GY73_9GAMM|nr:hypothetical protein N482_23625 [Pseudoalteromonas luteoviolacea NCIMB 1942]KZX00677.1 hypothetical protein JL49_10100 [Pseudoalteromonas luteoviolacea]